MTDILSFIKPEVRSLRPYTLPDHAYRIKINQNENPFGFPAALKEEAWQRVQERDWARYPDFFLTEITARLADHVGVPHGWVLVGNGSNELLQVTLMATLGRGDRILIPVPTFSLYKLLSRVMGAEVIEVTLNEGDFSLPTEKMIEAAWAKRAKALIICTPNNPTGVAYPEGEVRRLIEETDSLIVIDEAYGDFSDQDSLPLLEEYENVVILRTFSKAMAMAGLRVGYLIARPQLVEQIAKAKLPYGLNILSEATALVALENIDLLQEQVRKLRALRDDLLAQLESIPGVHPYPSQANFILCRFDKPTEEVFNGLLEDGLLVRDVSHYPMLNGHLRISVGTREENEALVGSLRRIVHPSPKLGEGPGVRAGRRGLGVSGANFQNTTNTQQGDHREMRTARIQRQTTETSIELELNLDGQGQHDIDTSIPFFDHMLSHLAMNGLFDLTIKARGDTEIDYHHTVEDVGIVLGEALRQGLGDKVGIRRYGSQALPMDEALVLVAIDLSGRGLLVFDVEFARLKVGHFEVELIEEFLRGLAVNAGMTLHVRLLAGRNAHHISEAIFKALGRALAEAVSIDPRRKGVPSTKGKL